MVTGILLEATLPVVVGLGLTAVLVRGLSSPRLCRLAARARGSSWRRLFGILAVVGLAAIGAAVAKLFVLPLGRAGVLLLGGSLVCYVHLEVLAAGHGFRQLDIDGPEDRSTLSHLTYWVTGWLTYTHECYTGLPFVCVGSSIVAVPAAFVVSSSVGVGGETAILAGGAVATEALLLAIGTGYRRLHQFPDEPRERVRDALDADDG